MNLNLKELSHDKLIELIETLILEVNQLKEENRLLKKENQKLKAQLGLNSSNSSKPPSTDSFKKKPKNNSLREKTDKNSGGQPNHKGHTLEKVDTPDFTVDIKDDICPCCSSNLQEICPVNITTRQVFDIPLPKIQVTEYKAYHKVCPHCNTKNNPVFPKNVTQPVSYGSNIQSLVTYLSIQNHIPYNRISSFVSDLFNCNLSEGTIFNILNRAYDSLETTENEIKNRLLQSPQIHADETGFYVEKLRQWLFSYSNKNYTFYDFHKKRGKEAMDFIGFMENYRYLYKNLEVLVNKYSLMSVINAVRELYIVRIELDSSDDAQQIFESINSTGEKLTAADLIRNYIMMKRNNDEQEKIYDKYWLKLERIFPESKKLAEFFRFYLASKTCILTTEKELYSAFKEYWKNNMGPQKYMEILEDLLNYAKHFERLYLTNNKDSLGEEIHDYRKIQSYMPAPFTMQILEYLRKNLITEKQTSSILKLINTYLVRRYINGQDTSAISRFFPGFLKNVETRVEEQNSYSKIVDICTYYLVNENKGKAAFMPDDNQLYTYLETANAYSLSNIRWVLDKIEMYGNPAPVLLDSLNIEHIMPQTQNEYWENETALDEDEYIKVINRIGNLTLAASSDNSKMGNKDFAHKKKVLESTQHLKLNEKILKKQRWLVADIEERTKELTSKIIEIFPYVQTDYYIRSSMVYGCIKN